MCALVNKLFIKNTTILVCTYLFVLLFLYAAISKLLDFETFSVQLAQSPLLSAYANIIAWLIPSLEIAIALLLTFPRFRTLALYAAFTLMVMFTAYIIIILNFSDFVPCSCGGVLEKLSWTQHLIFNIVFIILAGVAVFFTGKYSSRKTWLMLATLALFGIASVALLFAFSEKKMHRNNAFQRRYIPHPIEKIHSFDLQYSSYYFSGSGNGKVYLGNSTAPLLMTVIDSSFRDTKTTMIQLDQMELPYRAVKLHVIPPKFYVTDGTVPIILQGDIKEWKATTKMKGDFYFNQLYPIDSSKVIVKSNSSDTGENIIGTIEFGDSLKGIFTNKLLEKQIDGVFDTEGSLIYNPYIKKLIYTYYYRNQYIVVDQNLQLSSRGKTIDTVSIASLQIEENISKNQKKLGGKTLLINKNTASSKNLLLIESPRLGDLEPEDMFDEATIIDVYDVTNKSYRFSFYLYKHENSKLREFRIYNDLLYVLQGNYLVAYKLRRSYFD